MERAIEDIAVEQCGFYLPDKARYDYLLHLKESDDVGFWHPCRDADGWAAGPVVSLLSTTGYWLPSPPGYKIPVGIAIALNALRKPVEV